jgi:hypothetical protein
MSNNSIQINYKFLGGNNCNQLLQDYKRSCESGGKPQADLLKFALDEKISQNLFKENTELTIYNPTKPMTINGKNILLGRVETFEDELNSKVMFFEQIGTTWHMIGSAPQLDLQDPFYAQNIQGYQILGGVKLFPQKNGYPKYQTVFYKFKQSIDELYSNNCLSMPFASGPMGMKDIRLIELKDKKIGVFTRPQGGEAGLGKIGYVEINSLEELETRISEAKIIEGQFKHDEWGGANELHLLNNGNIGVLGHIAHKSYSEENGRIVKNYYAMSFIFNPYTKIASDMKIIATADQFPHIRPKFDSLGQVIFSGGLQRNGNGEAILYAGINDTSAACFLIKDPFLQFEG